MRLEDLAPRSSLVGLEPSTIATLVAVVPTAEGSVQAGYPRDCRWYVEGTNRDRTERDTHLQRLADLLPSEEIDEVLWHSHPEIVAIPDFGKIVQDALPVVQFMADLQ
jgi:hypothetical protein